MLYRILTVLFAACIWMGPGLSAGFAQVHSKVVDEDTGQPVPDVHLYWKSQLKHHKGTVTDSDGRFSLELSPHKVDTLIVQALGYQKMGLLVHKEAPEIPQPIKLRSEVYEIEEELLVLGNQRRYQKTEIDRDRWGAAQWLDRENASTALVRRGPHASELLVRGLSGDRVPTRVNDIPMFSACVDKMDPVTSYLNPASVQGLERSDDELGAPGTVNIRLKKPGYGNGWRGRLQSSYQTSVEQPKVNATVGYGSRHWAWEATGYWMQAGNLVAGGGEEIENSQQHQLNGNTTLRYQQENHEFELHGAYNRSWDIGYPALLMDATEALSYLGSLEYINHPDWAGVSAISTKIYANRVEHTMDDYSRDVANREVMRNMHMPMEGTTETFGIRQQWSGSFTDHTWTAGIEWYRVDAFGDMRMESLFESVPDMYLLNLGDIRQQNVGLDLSWNYQLDRNDLLSVESKVEYKDREVRRASSARYFETIFGEGQAQRRNIGWNAKLQLSHSFESDLELAASVSTRHRAPSYKELFGYYIYNYDDGFFYNGNPTLNTEEHYTFDILFAVDRESFSLEFIPNINYVHNWISGVFDEGFAGQDDDYQFKEYRNTGDALLAGADLQVDWRPAEHWHLSNHLQYTYGQHLDWDEPLRMIPPLNGNFSLMHHRRRWSVSADWTWAAAQKRIAMQHSVENTTPAYQVINLNGTLTVAPSIDLSLNVHNLLDNYYWTHTSIGDIPARGRTVELSVSWKW
ncbi:MAG TPA: TonB-dependent receptor [Fodinibius sp.]|nr:TonB-dependent receptor [Fodinibius sp.]